MKSALIFIVWFLQLFFYVDGFTKTTYRAAVVDYEPPENPNQNPTLEYVLSNAYALSKYAVEARWEGVDILVFPEAALTGIIGIEEFSDNSFAQDAPDPKEHDWNPCADPNKFENTKVLQILSCAARFNAMIIVANLITRRSCDSTPCPASGHFYYNTNLVFNNEGKYISRYDKRHLFFEPALTPSPEIDYTIVDVGFMKFATLICFDIIHRDPAIKQIKEQGVRNIIFTTAWINILPFLTAPQFFSSYARGLGVNLVASNMHYPDALRMGSGIFTTTGVLNQTFDLESSGKMIIADLPIIPEDVSEGDLTCNGDLYDEHSEEQAASTVTLGFEELTITNKPSTTNTSRQTAFANIPLKSFSVYYLDKNEGHVDLCKNDFCCHLDYEFENRDDSVYVMAVDDGVLEYKNFKFGGQACAVLLCENEDRETCGRVPKDDTSTTGTVFKQLTIMATFDTDVVFPQMFGTDLQILPTNSWEFSLKQCTNDDEDDEIYRSKMKLIQQTEQSVLSVSLIGRVFERDS